MVEMTFLSFIFSTILHSKNAIAYESFDIMAYAMSRRFDSPIVKLEDIQEVEKIVFLDAREKDEFDISHIPKAFHVGYEDFDLTKTLQIIPKDSITVVVYCSVGYRSGKIAQVLNENGVEAYNLYGGIFHWSNSKYPLEDSKSHHSTLRIHGYNTIWSQWITHGEIYLP